MQGRHLPQDPDAAYLWLLRAARSLLASCEAASERDVQDLALDFPHLTVSHTDLPAMSGQLAQAALLLGYLRYDGEACNQDSQEAICWFQVQRAAHLNRSCLTCRSRPAQACRRFAGLVEVWVQRSSINDRLLAAHRAILTIGKSLEANLYEVRPKVVGPIVPVLGALHLEHGSKCTA